MLSHHDVGWPEKTTEDEVSRLRDTLRQVRDDLTLIVADHKLGRDANVRRAFKSLRAALQ